MYKIVDSPSSSLPPYETIVYERIVQVLLGKTTAQAFWDVYLGTSITTLCCCKGVSSSSSWLVVVVFGRHRPVRYLRFRTTGASTPVVVNRR
jgi:hypothetical protein